MSSPLRSGTNTPHIGALLASATNGLAKGFARYFTPLPFGQHVASVLPRHRRTVVDLACGHGALLAAARNDTTELLLGADIVPLPAQLGTPGSAGIRQGFIESDLADLHPLLRRVGFTTDLIVLNPPWGLRWHRDRFALLAESESARIRRAFLAHDQQGRDTIDSTVCTLLVALDLLTDCGEGLLIGNAATLDRLLFAEDAPHGDLVPHVWARRTFAGNTCLAGAEFEASVEAGFRTMVLWFARSHETGPGSEDPAEPSLPHRRQRRGGEATSYLCASTEPQWHAVRDETARRRMERRNDWNLQLQGGRIQVNLTRFDSFDAKVDAKQAAALQKLNGRRLEQVVQSRDLRDLLIEGTGVRRASPWRVKPDLVDAVQKAIAAYDANRAPLYPLTPIMRLGYLDEVDYIRCHTDLGDGAFRAGRNYPIKSGTTATRRQAQRVALNGEPEDYDITGQELELLVTDEHKKPRRFMAESLRLHGWTLPDIGQGLAGAHIDFTLETLAAHFDIPDVLDAARVHPDLYAATVREIHAIEDWLNHGTEPAKP